MEITNAHLHSGLREEGQRPLLELLAAALAAEPIAVALVLSARGASCFLYDEATEVAVVAANRTLLDRGLFLRKWWQGPTPGEEGVGGD